MSYSSWSGWDSGLAGSSANMVNLGKAMIPVQEIELVNLIGYTKDGVKVKFLGKVRVETAYVEKESWSDGIATFYGGWQPANMTLTAFPSDGGALIELETSGWKPGLL